MPLLLRMGDLRCFWIRGETIPARGRSCVGDTTAPARGGGETTSLVGTTGDEERPAPPHAAGAAARPGGRPRGYLPARTHYRGPIFSGVAGLLGWGFDVFTSSVLRRA